MVRRYSYNSEWQTPVVNIELVVYVGIVWLLVFLLGILGLKRLKKVTVNLQIGFATIMAFLGLASFSNVEFQHHKFKYANAADVSIKVN